MFFFTWVRNFAYNYLGTFGFLTFIIDFNFIIFEIQFLKHSIDLHILIYATYIYATYIYKFTQKIFKIL
jgi:hypothetical protein